MAEPIALGFTVKSGWACAVLLSLRGGEPQLVDSRRVELSDSEVPDARQPYHDGFGTARASGPSLDALVSSVERFGRESVARLVGEHRSNGHVPSGAGIVVGSLADPAGIANDHIRIHALEGRLFRRTVEEAVRALGLPSTVYRERDLRATAAAKLGRTEAAVLKTITALGRFADGPWRAEQKAAALAAWLFLAATSAELRS
jgi:hypothetical protein